MALDAQLQLELALRRRIIDTLQTRIHWAETLHSALSSDTGHASVETFRSVALDALALVEAPAACILASDPPAPPNNNPVKPVRPLPRQVPAANPKNKGSFLFVRPSALSSRDQGDGNHLYLLRCPSCLRTSFTSLQGLLNHARLAHNLEWGTHDECIRGCAVPDNDLDVQHGIEVGSGVLPGLRSIFQLAVGAQPTALVPDDSAVRDNDQALKNPPQGAHLNQTLGIHEDTPALAPYLGKEPVKKGIRVWDEKEVDILMLSDRVTSSRKPRWRMTFSQRNFIEDMVLVSKESATDRSQFSTSQEAHSSQATVPSATQSRFHLIARVGIVDRSAWVPPGQRQDKNTHKWMICVDAPAYSHHISSILHKICLVDIPPDVVVCQGATQPPFVVNGTASKPFLATLRLLFVGTTDGSLPVQELEVEHWVEASSLTSSKTGTAAGEPQVLDIELSRHTALKAVVESCPSSTKHLWSSQPLAESQSCASTSASALVTYETILSHISQEFPLTDKDTGTRTNKPLPYTLFPSPSHFNAAVLGRQKAIEWRRARAIRDAYTNLRASSVELEDLPELSVGDVVSWIRTRERAQTPKEKMNRSSDRRASPSLESPCSLCGLPVQTNPSDNTPQPDLQQRTLLLCNGSRCNLVPSFSAFTTLPALDFRVFTPPFFAPIADPHSLRGASSHAVQADPRWCTWVAQTMANQEKVKSTNRLSTPCTFSTDGQLAPSALLAIATKRLARALIEGGLSVAADDQARASQLRVSRTNTPPTRVTQCLTPNHILRALIRRSPKDLSSVVVQAVSRPALPLLSGAFEPCYLGEADRPVERNDARNGDH